MSTFPVNAVNTIKNKDTIKKLRKSTLEQFPLASLTQNVFWSMSWIWQWEMGTPKTT